MRQTFRQFIDREEGQHSKAMTGVLSLFFVIIISAVVVGWVHAAPATYYVDPSGSDSNDCSRALPCLTFNHAYQVADSGDTVIVAAGTYNNQTIDYDGTKTSAVTFQAARDGGGNAADINSQIYASGASHVVIDGRNADGSYGNHWKVSEFTATANNGHAPTDWTLYGLHYAQTAGTRSVYIEGPSSDIALIGGEVGPSIGDGIQIAARASDNAGTSDITVQAIYCHDNDGAPGDQPDCIQVTSPDWHGNNKTYILGNYFEHNDNSNLSCDTHSDNVVVANNIFQDTYVGDSGLSASSAVQCDSSSAQYLYNTFLGAQQIQAPPQDSNGSPRLDTFIGNLGNGVDQGCMPESTYSYNVWSNSGDVCGTGDQKVSDIGINTDGSLKSDSPAIGAGDPALFPVVDYRGSARTSPPEAGALTFGNAFTTAPINPTLQTVSTPDNTSVPTISGTVMGGQELTASTGTWTNSPSSYRYQWQRCAGDYSNCFNIDGATSSTYTLVSNDTGTHISVVVQAVNDSGSLTASSDYTSVVVAATDPPVNTAAPTISGTLTEAEQLTTTNGSWTNVPTFTYQWQRCTAGDTSGTSCVNITNATSSTYTLVTADVGKAVRSVVTGTNGAGSAVAQSDVSATVAALTDPPVNTVAPDVSGITAVDATLRVTNGSWTNAPTFTYQWQRCTAGDTSGISCVNITNATSSTYTLVTADVGKAVRAIVTATNSIGSASANSTITADIQALLGDFNNDGVVNLFDLGVFLSHWQSTTSPSQDFNNDGVVNMFDLGIFLSHYNT